MSVVHILLVDDDSRFRRLMRRFLERDSFSVEEAESGSVALTLIAERRFDCILLDVMMPEMDGHAVLARLQPRAIPVIFLTARGDVEDRLRGLQRGADDYVTKPCDPREVAARVRAVVRRSGTANAAENLLSGEVVITPESGGCYIASTGKPVSLTDLELALLSALMRQEGRALRREDIRTLAGRGDTAVSDRALDVHVHSIRKKLGQHGEQLHTVRGVGYVWKGKG